MSSTNSYTFTIKKQGLQFFFKDLATYTDGICKCQTGGKLSFELFDVNKASEQDFFYGGGFALSLLLDLDENIIEYLKNNHSDKNTLSKKAAYIGFIYVYVTPNYSVDDYVNIKFTASVGDMGYYVFSQSNSLSKLFMGLCKKHNPVLLFSRDAGIMVYWYNGRECLKYLEIEISDIEFGQLFFLQNKLAQQ